MLGNHLHLHYRSSFKTCITCCLQECFSFTWIKGGMKYFKSFWTKETLFPEMGVYESLMLFSLALANSEISKFQLLLKIDRGLTLEEPTAWWIRGKKFHSCALTCWMQWSNREEQWASPCSPTAGCHSGSSLLLEELQENMKTLNSFLWNSKIRDCIGADCIHRTYPTVLLDERGLDVSPEWKIECLKKRKPFILPTCPFW